jgi:hypothetical protein
VREVDALDLERPGLGDLADRQDHQVDVAQLVLVELGARHGDGQLAAVDDRDLVLPEVAQDPRQGAQVVLVAVGDDDRRDVVDALAQIREVRQHEIDAHHLGRREAQPQSTTTSLPRVFDDLRFLPISPRPRAGAPESFTHVVWTSWSNP